MAANKKLLQTTQAFVCANPNGAGRLLFDKGVIVDGSRFGQVDQMIVNGLLVEIPKVEAAAGTARTDHAAVDAAAAVEAASTAKAAATKAAKTAAADLAERRPTTATDAAGDETDSEDAAED